MFFRCRRRGFLLKWLLVLLGFKFVTKDRLTDEERANYRAKAKTFRSKLRDAFAVWDEEDSTQAKQQESNGDE